MQLLLRKISSDSSGVQEYADSEIEREEIVIGSSPQSDIQLLGSGIAATHARLQLHNGRLRLRAEKGRTFLYRGEPQREAELADGDEIRIGSQVFVCTSTPGFDLSLEWHYSEMPGHLLANAYRASLADLSFSPRKLSWILAVGILLIFGLAPAMEYFWSEPTGENIQAGHMPLGSLWLSGPLLPAHQVVLGNDCRACHQSAFVQVEDQACQQCHSETKNHLAAQHPGLTELGKFGDFDRFSCQNCHKEHNEPQSLIATSDQLCRSCHQQMEPAIAGFSAASHPPFALSLLQPDVELIHGALETNWRREKVLPQSELKEVNHLNFPHDLHLDVEAVRHLQRDDALQCVDCHRLSSDREHFEPIVMENHCGSCHELSFDERNPQKQLPHGLPQAVFDVLEAHFVKQAFSEALGDDIEWRRRPGRERVDESCEADYDCARQQAMREAERQFSKGGCVTCHQVDEVPGAQEIDRWKVLPVRLNDNWFASARFDHQSHLTQAEQRGDELCLSCHQATTSSTSADILMPTLGECVDCHSDQSTGGRVAVNCIACHGYHQSDEPPSFLGNVPHDHKKFTGAVSELLKGVANGEL